MLLISVKLKLKMFSGFFVQWQKFANAFKASVKYNRAQIKKEQALKSKEDQKKKKEEEDKVMNKVVTTLRKSQANLKQNLDTNTPIDGFFANRERRNTRGQREDRRTKEKDKDKAIDSLVDDILSNDPAAARPRRGGRDETGVVKQLSKGLRDSRTFSKIRENRGKDEVQEDDKEKAHHTKVALQRQISSKLTRYK